MRRKIRSEVVDPEPPNCKRFHKPSEKLTTPQHIKAEKICHVFKLEHKGHSCWTNWCPTDTLKRLKPPFFHCNCYVHENGPTLTAAHIRRNVCEKDLNSPFLTHWN